ncbi:hypothetical protein OIU84_025032 [Salix udensis]|uniref:Histone chaperone domain-containing protein n=1 Tax=Salix udensis TaxID=889485 RepID=A0AAD6PBD0_9ROSI|nr:hypothetical protein OIU84_025032 [Salix udensis]
MAETETQNEPTLSTKRKLDEDPVQPSIDNQNDTVQEGEDEHDEEEDEDDEEEDDEEDDDDDYEDGEEKREEAVVDRKGKGILIEEGVDDDDEDEEGSELEGGDDSEEAEEDDPLAEVDLDNILPSRTRRKVVHPGVYIANDDDGDDSNA